MLGGTLVPDAGRVLLDGADLAGTPPRGRALRGVVRTLQSTAAFAELTALENVLVGAGLRRVHGGALRTAAATPLAARRGRRAAARPRAKRSTRSGSRGPRTFRRESSRRPSSGCSASRRRSRREPRVLLLDEPAAGASQADLVRIAALLARLRDRGRRGAPRGAQSSARALGRGQGRGDGGRQRPRRGHARGRRGRPGGAGRVPRRRGAVRSRIAAAFALVLVSPSQRAAAATREAAPLPGERRGDAARSPSTRRSRAARTSARRSRTASSWRSAR